MSSEYLMKPNAMEAQGSNESVNGGTPDLKELPSSEYGSASPEFNGKRKRRKVAIACVFCRRSHMICDSGTPCSRCVKRKIGHLCHYEPASQKQEKQLSKIKPEPSPSVVSPQSPPVLDYNFSNSIYRQSDMPQEFPQPENMGAINQQPFFFSEHAGSEFSSLNEFLSMIDDTDMMNSLSYDDPVLQNLDSAMNSSTNLQAKYNQVTPSVFSNMNVPGIPAQISSFSSTNTMTQLGDQTERNSTPQQQPMISDSARDKFFLTAADPTTEISPEERLKQVIKAKLDAGLLKPYNYAKGYARLQSYMDKYMNASSRQRILKPLSTFRPGFRAVAKTLKDIDLILVEENFERMLLDYDRVFTSMAIPACLWRRTGEIYRGDKEFASLVEVSIDDLKNGKLTIYEVMTEESSVNFWEKYGSIAFDKTQKAVLTSCNLRTRDGRKRKSCCFSFTIRRDRYNIPSCIVGNFIPISQ